jgi:hypothetical protein
VTDKEGKHIGSVSKEGVIKDAAGVKVAHLDGTGSLIDTKTGKNLGKVGKNRNFVPYSSTEARSTSSAEDGVCQIKDKAGSVKVVVHETYKNIGACAIDCLTHHIKHGDVVVRKISTHFFAPLRETLKRYA